MIQPAGISSVRQLERWVWVVGEGEGCLVVGLFAVGFPPSAGPLELALSTGSC